VKEEGKNYRRNSAARRLKLLLLKGLPFLSRFSRLFAARADD
jgi:hypothetical protein